MVNRFGEYFFLAANTELLFVDDAVWRLLEIYSCFLVKLMFSLHKSENRSADAGMTTLMCVRSAFQLTGFVKYLNLYE